MNNVELYSVNGAEPGPLPGRIRLKDGSTKTGNYTEEDLKEAGITGPYEYPSNLEEFHNVVWEPETLSYRVFDTPDEYLYNLVRQDRNQFLRETDWTQLSDAPISDEKKEEFRVYRQALRDMTSTIKDPKREEIRWPKYPS